MFYKCSDPKTSTRDWFALNVDSIPPQIVKVMTEDGAMLLHEILPDAPDEPDTTVEPMTDDTFDGDLMTYVEPTRDDYPEGIDGDLNFADDLATIKAHNEKVREIVSEREGMDLLPMWGTFFHVEDHPDLRAACFEAGLRLFEHDDINGLLLGVEGAGYDFYGAHWIPLRATLALRHQLDGGGTPAERRRSRAKREAFLTMLAKEAAGTGEGRRLEAVVAAETKKEGGRKAA